MKGKISEFDFTTAHTTAHGTPPNYTSWWDSTKAYYFDNIGNANSGYSVAELKTLLDEINNDKETHKKEVKDEDKRTEAQRWVDEWAANQAKGNL